MSGKILIVDEMATNRIVLKVKLSITNFDVLQAHSSDEALRVATRDRPDMILVSAALGGDADFGLLGTLRSRPDLAFIPVVLVLPEDTAEARMRAFQAGADDVIAHPFDVQVLIARLRGVLRQHNTLQELRMQAGPARTVGFSETQGPFQRPGRIALIAPDKRDALRLRAQLIEVLPHDVIVLVGDCMASKPAADLFVITLAPGQREAALQTMAELHTTTRTRHSALIALVPLGGDQLAATLLDMGANDVMQSPPNPTELVLRMVRQIRQKRAADELRHRLRDGMRAAMTDPLTGLYNRRFALPFLRQLAEATVASPQPFAVMIADLDHFKQINDSFGHMVGDRVLVHVANLLRTNLRQSDMLARIGGEEFLVVMPGTGQAEALDVADRLCQIVRRTPLLDPVRSGGIPVTISIGVTLGLCETSPGPVTAEMLVEQADNALYSAKSRGRDMVTLQTARPAA